jgi:MoxR-like ATPase
MNRTTEAQDEDLAGRVAAGREKILEQLRLVIVGQDEVVDQVLIALFTGGHCLLTGVPASST